MPGKLQSWPAWQEFETPPKGLSEETIGAAFSANAKAEVIAQYGEEALRESWLKVCKALEAVRERLSTLGSEAVPVLDMEEVLDGGLSDSRRAELKSSGCCIVRSVVGSTEATELFNDFKTFVADNKDSISGWPVESPSMLRVYNSPTQVAIRTHPNQILLQRTLNSLFHDESGGTSPEPLSYTDAARIRPPGQAFLGLGPHIDAGSLCRWADARYRKVYDSIFSGNPELHDAYDLNVRKDADQFLFKANAHSVVFRSFQGWTALTPASASRGTLMLYPEVSTVIAYVVLRPFFAPPANRDDIMDASKWTFDPDSSWFPGTLREQSQRLSPSSHPHLGLQECLVHIPPMNPGDTVWWHTDMCHAVDPEHLGDQDASVVYAAACPTTPRNKEYVKEQLKAALDGNGPPDCPNVAVDESKLKGYRGFADVSEEGKAVLGFGLL
ncbi:hypothetical protein EDB81DRAFT_849626 [Dactylonectria macrodidyma]|uniref:DUF1479-domain-containing protein n=1 Tax=Dactylonectria macrodidyma TaxID=307937 RepID=A0A9P9JHY5_9HYPO|nr:hypothetical protein EDB81DRAFT_849626 [Dactylonectria macrodidyma]